MSYQPLGVKGLINSLLELYDKISGSLTDTGLRYNLCFPDEGNDMAITLSELKNIIMIT